MAEKDPEGVAIPRHYRNGGRRLRLVLQSLPLQRSDLRGRRRLGLRGFWELAGPGRLGEAGCRRSRNFGPLRLDAWPVAEATWDTGNDKGSVKASAPAGTGADT